MSLASLPLLYVAHRNGVLLRSLGSPRMAQQRHIRPNEQDRRQVRVKLRVRRFSGESEASWFMFHPLSRGQILAAARVPSASRRSSPTVVMPAS